MLDYPTCLNCGGKYVKKGNHQKHCHSCKIALRKLRNPAYQKKYYLKNKDAVLAHAHEYQRSDRGKEVSNKTRKKMKERYPEKIKARYAVKAGKLVKPIKCEMCHAETRLHGHHPDYSKPLEVRWLCPGCHRLIHRPLEELLEFYGEKVLLYRGKTNWYAAKMDGIDETCFEYYIDDSVLEHAIGPTPSQALANLILAKSN